MNHFFQIAFLHLKEVFFASWLQLLTFNLLLLFTVLRIGLITIWLFDFIFIYFSIFNPRYPLVFGSWWTSSVYFYLRAM